MIEETAGTHTSSPNEEAMSEYQQNLSLESEILNEEPHSSTQSPPTKRRRVSQNMEETLLANSSLESTKITNIKAQTAHVHSEPVQNIYYKKSEDDTDYESLGKKLKEDLHKVADEKSGFLPTPVLVKEHYEAVGLEIVKDPIVRNPISVERNLYSRKKLAEIYTKSPKGNVLVDNIFTVAKENAEMKSSHAKSKSKSSYIQQHGNIVSIVGQAGIGKTTFLKTYVQKVLKNLLPFQVSFLFLIFVRELNFTKTCTLLQFLLHSMLPDWHHTKKSDQALLKLLNDDPNVFIAIDGLDEAPQHVQHRYKKVSLFGKSAPWDFLSNLIEGDLFTKAKKLVTSRPSSIYRMSSPPRPHCLLQILGLSKASQESLGRQICREKYDDLKIMVNENPDLSLYWYVPIYYIMALAHFCKMKKGQSVVVAFTAILSSTFVDYASSEHLRGKAIELEHLAAFAFDNLRESQCIFDRKQLQNSGMSENTINAFLQTSLTTNSGFKVTILQGQQVSYFSHLIWQEFFAAFHAMTALSIREFAMLFVNQHQTSEVLIKFLCGFCNRKVFQQLKEVVTTFTTLWLVKKNFIKNYLKTKVSQAFRKEDLVQLFKYCTLLKEANDESILTDVVSKMPTNLSITFSGTILPSNIAGLCYVLQGFLKETSTMVKIIKFDETRHSLPSFYEDSFQRFARGIALGIKVQELNMSSYTIGNEDIPVLCNALPNIRQLKIKKCGITPQGMQHIAHKLSELEHQMDLLDISGNAILDEGLNHLVGGLQNINKLHMADCGITSYGTEILSKKLETLDTAMDSLNLSGNEIDNSGISSLAINLKKINKLEVVMCNITGEGIKKLADALLKNDDTMELLDLSENSIEASGINALMECGQKVKKIRLLYCSINKKEINKLTEMHPNVFVIDDVSQQQIITYATTTFYVDDILQYDSDELLSLFC